MGPLDFLKQKLQQGLSTVENWGSDAGNDITHAVGALFGTNAPQPKQPTVVQQPQTNRSALPPQLQPQNQPANPAQQQLPKPIQLQDQQPNSVPLSNFSAPKPASNVVKVAQPTAQVAPPNVAPIRIANSQPSPFVSKLVGGGFSQAAQPSQATAIAAPKSPVTPPAPNTHAVSLPAISDEDGLTTALQNIDSYKPNDQVTLIQRGALSGLIPKNVAASTVQQILEPAPYHMPSLGQEIGETAKGVAETLLPGVSQLSEQLGTNLAASDLFDQVKNGKMDYQDAYNAVNQSSNEHGFDLGMKTGDVVAQAAKEAAAGTATAALSMTAPILESGLSTVLTRTGLDVLLGPSVSTVLSHAAGGALIGGSFNTAALLASAAPLTWKNVAASFGQGAFIGGVLGGLGGVQAAKAQAFDKYVTSFPDAETFAKENLAAAREAGFKNVSRGDLIKLYNETQARTSAPKNATNQVPPQAEMQKEDQTIEQPRENPASLPETTSRQPAPAEIPQAISSDNTQSRLPEEGTQPISQGSHETYENNTTTESTVNHDEGFPQRNADAERAAIAEYESGGTLKQATKEYMKYEPVDSMTANRAVVTALQDAGHLPRGTDDITALLKPLDIPKGLPKDVTDSAKALDKAYRETPKHGKDVSELTSQVRGRESRFKGLSAEFEKSLRRNFTPAERQAIRDNLEGAAKPEEVTPKVQAATDLARQLNDKALNIRALAKEDVGHVRQYATRIAARGRSTGNAIKVSKPNDIFNTESRYSNSRVVRKYVSADGEARYGSLKDAGLHRNQDGELVAGNKVFHPASVSTRELNEHGYNYANDYGAIAKSYHSDTGSLKARYDALQQLLKNADQYQLHSAEDAQPGDVEVVGVPELQGMYAPRAVAREIERTFKAGDRRAPAERALNTLTSGVVNQIVMNPIFHTKNLLQLAIEASGNIPLAEGSRLESGPLGVFKVGTKMLRLMTDADYRRSTLLDYLRDGRLPDYGTHTETALTRAADELGIPHLSKTFSSVMEKIDTTFRLSTYAAFRDAGIDGTKAVKTIDFFMGDTRNASRIEQNFGMFWNYFRTKVRAGVGVFGHPIANHGAIVNLALTGAALMALTKSFRDWMGNQHGSIGFPGVFGLYKEGADIFDELKNGNPGGVTAQVVNNINPLITTGINQATATDLYSGQRLNTGADRLANLESTLLPGSQYVTKVNNGKASVGQEALQFATGVSLPHTQGAPAVSNKNNPLASLINLPGATPSPDQGNIHDPTGIDQATAYYNAKNKMLNSIAGDTAATAIVNNYMSKDRTPDGKTILNNQYQQAQNDGSLLKSDTALKAMQDFNKGQPNHAPLWDLPLDKLKIYLSYKSMIPGDPNQVVLEQKNPWLTDEFNKEAAWGSSIQQSPNTVEGQGYVPYPKLTPNQQDMMAQVTQLSANQNRTPEQEKQLQDLEANPDLQQAFGLLNKYTNDRRALWPGVQPIPYPSSSLSPEQEQMLQQEAALPKGARSAFIRANQDSWNQIQQVLAENTIYNVERYGGIVQQGGTEPSFLKDVYNAGKYDIAPVQQADGSTSYQVNPGLAYQIARSGSGSGGSSKKPLVPLPKRPKKNVARVVRMKKSRTNHKIHIAKSPRIHIKKEQVLKPVHIGHGGPLKIKNK